MLIEYIGLVFFALCAFGMIYSVVISQILYSILAKHGKNVSWNMLAVPGYIVRIYFLSGESVRTKGLDIFARTVAIAQVMMFLSFGIGMLILKSQGH